jgi:hypothetical protein
MHAFNPTLPPIRLDPDQWYYEWQLHRMGLDDDDITAARKAGEVRFRQLKQGRIFRGQWVIDWLEGKTGGDKPAA